jgi:hypothetical protein
MDGSLGPRLAESGASNAEAGAAGSVKAEGEITALDLVFACDCTGSMGSYIRAAQV